MKNLSKKVYRKDNETEDTSFSKGAYFKLTNKNNTMEVKMKPDLFQSILFVALQRKIDMNEIMKFLWHQFVFVWLTLMHISSLLKELKTWIKAP